MMKKYLLIVLLMFGVCAVGFAGCGNSEEPVAEDTYEDEIIDEEIIQDEYDPYVDGITLEEAKEGDYGTVFIKDNILYYPLIPSYDSNFIEGMTREESNAQSVYDHDEDVLKKWYRVSPEYAKHDLPTLTKERQLVEVEGETIGYVSKIAEKPVYTLPCMVRYSLADEYVDEYTTTLKPKWSIEFGDEYYGDTLKTLDGKEMSYEELDKLAFSLREVDDYNLSDEVYETFKEFDWDYLYKEYSLKPVRVDFDGRLSVNMLFAKEEDESVNMNYRADGDVDSNQEQRIADEAVYNLPNDINQYEKPERFNYKYEQTDEGYSIINTDEIPAGAYATHDGYLFRKE